jgi:hypothetical protein
MLPKSVSCDQCDQTATVCGYGRIEYDWPNSGSPDANGPPATPQIRAVRLIVDCPHCGLSVQDHYPLGQPAGGRGALNRAALLRRLRAVSAALRQ